MGKGTEEVEVCLSVACFLEGKKDKKGQGLSLGSLVQSPTPEM